MKYIIGDIHGCYKTLLALIEKLPKNAEIVFVGDLVDRGPRSAEVIEFIKKNKYPCVLGNHEKMMLTDIQYVIDRIEDESKYFFTDWERNGGYSCIESYKNNVKLMKEHLEWLKELPYFIEFKEEKDEQNRYLLVSHSSVVNFFNEYKEEKRDYVIERYEESIIWNRSIPYKTDNIFFNVFGHTPIEYMKGRLLSEELNKKFSYKNILLSKEIGFADIDSGCVFKKELTALEYPTLKVFTQECID